MLLNKPRAYEIMDKYGLDGLVARDPKNVYYLTDFWGALLKMQRDFGTFAVLPRAIDAPAALILSRSEVRRLISQMPTWVPNVVPCSYKVKAESRDFDPDLEEPEADEGMSWAGDMADSTGVEARFVNLLQEQTGRWAATPAWGLRRALKEAGLENARLGTDDPRLLHWMQEMGLPNIQPVDAINIFREIRMIKSEEEIGLLREAGRINEEACEAAIRALREDAPWADVEREFMVEVARQDGQGIYLSGGSLDGRVEGPTVTMDALSQYKHYHGDLGRTISLVEPTRQMIQRNKAMLAGLETAYELTRPGLAASELSREVCAAIHRAGFPEYVFVSPHSIGLEHTDHPLPMGPELPGSKAGLTLQKDMVFNLDMPYHEWGWGGMHLEETIRVTATGCELLTSGKAELRTAAITH